MPIHDWPRVESGLFHDFHLGWICELSRILNGRLLTEANYALIERTTDGFGPDLRATQGWITNSVPPIEPGGISEDTFYAQKRNAIGVRQVPGDQLVALIDIVSPGCKSTYEATVAYITRARQFLTAGVPLLILDLHPPGDSAPQGIHAAIWETLTESPPEATPTKPLTLVSYEAAGLIRAYVKYVAVGETLPEMPLFLQVNGQIPLPLEATYERAFANVPRRIRERLERPPE